MNKYKHDRECRACGFHGMDEYDVAADSKYVYPDIMYCGGTHLVTEGNKILRTCRRCNFKWYEKPLFVEES